MAVEDKYLNADQVAGRKVDAALNGGTVRTIIRTFETAAADDDGSVFRIDTVPSDAVPLRIGVYTDGITGMTDVDVGLYEKGVGEAAVDADVLADGLDLSSANAGTTIDSNGMTTVDLAAYGSTFGELLEAASSGSDTESEYDVAITANTMGSGVGTITVVMEVIA